MRTFFLLVVMTSLALLGCAQTSSSQKGLPTVVCTTTMIADIASNRQW